MTDSAIHAITMPKWGMAMQEGTVTGWHRAQGQPVATGDEVVDAESTKAAAAIESRVSGVLSRIVAQPGDVVPVGGLIGVIATGDVPEAEIDEFVARFEIPAAEYEEQNEPSPTRVAIGARYLNVLEFGAGDPPVLFIHGFGGDHTSWQFNLPTIAQDRRTIALDLPGHGLSSPEVGEGTIVALGEAVRELMDVRDLRAIHLVGHSLGGAIAVHLAATQPHRCASLTLIASAGLGPDIDDNYIAQFLAARRHRDLRPAVMRLFASDRLVTRAMLEAIIRARRIDGIEAALGRIADACFPAGRQAERHLADAVRGLAVPVQLIWGADDRIIPPSHAAGVGRTTVIPAAGHMVHMEQPDRVNALLLEFLNAARS
jgi:pyruvate dehydrogenase E2 component (dihydrolipoamide acetyltransferase)